MIPATVIAAAVRLADALARENQALATLDLPRAAALLEEKGRLAAAFAAAQAEAGAAPAPLAPRDLDAVRDVAARLGELARENRRLLERAMKVQGRVIETVARAGQPAVSRYGMRGAPSRARTEPMTLSSRA